ncbi:hypothetical protein IU501_23175 [Nocardia otitidiscaviarum]|nr:hypothetical protein [Nocardia otitidiscaviarum]MBF6135898.1 hypothetical protein [Nocardia otitidiscaviarum]
MSRNRRPRRRTPAELDAEAYAAEVRAWRAWVAARPGRWRVAQSRGWARG